MDDFENDVSLSGNANDVVDRVLVKFKRRRIDPLPVKINTESLKIRRGQIRGLSSIRRCGDCSFNAVDRETKIKLQLEVSDISAYLEYQVLAGIIWIKGEIAAVAKRIAVDLEVSLADEKIHLNSFDVLKLEGYRITQLTGVTPAFNWLLKFSINSMMHALRHRLIKTLEKEGKEGLQQLINQFPLSKL